MNVNDAYELYRNNPTDENYAQLYKVTREYALSIGKGLRGELGTYQTHACENVATTVLLCFREQFDPAKASFSTWAYRSMHADLIDWRRKKERILDGESAYTDFSALVRPTAIAPDDKVLIEQIVSRLSEDERELLRLKILGRSLPEMAFKFKISVATVKRRWDDLIEKARQVAVVQ